MKTIAIVGDVDKRVLVYPLSRALSVENSVMIATDDGAYRRLYQDKSSVGTIGKTDIIVGANFNENMLELTNMTGIQYDICLAVLNSPADLRCDYAVYCKGINKSFRDEKYISTLAGVESKTVVISCEAPRDRNVEHIVVDESVVRYLFHVEEHKQLGVLRNKNANKSIARLFSDAIDRTESQLYKLLTSKYIWNNKKK